MGVKTLRREPCDLRRNMIWLYWIRRDDMNVPVRARDSRPDFRSRLEKNEQVSGSRHSMERTLVTFNHSVKLWLKSSCIST